MRYAFRTGLVALSLSCALPAVALDLPSRKAGLWELKTTHEGAQGPPDVIQQCIDAATDKLLSDKFAGNQSCSKPEIRKSGATFVSESSCKMGAVATTTRATYDGDFDFAFTIKISTTQEGGAGGAARPQTGGTKNMTIQAKWTGPCKAGQKPGDVETADGKKMNILELSKTPNPAKR
jgi:hypothetical protein